MKMLTHRILMFCLISGSAVHATAAQVDGKSIALQGNDKGAIACIACHGRNGEGNAVAGYPYLAGLPAAYTEHQLRSFRDGSRRSAVMKPIAGGLSDDEIKALADYFASLPAPVPTAKGRSDSTDGGLGAKLAHHGKWEVGVPACFQCHGDNGAGIAPHFPPINGQPAAYIRQQLQDWQSGARANDPLSLMQAVVKQLSQNEIDAVASYLAAQAGQ